MEIALDTRVTAARVRGTSGWEGASVPTGLDALADQLRDAGTASAFLATPQATNEDLFAFRTLAEKVGGMLDFRVGDPQDKVRVQEDGVLLRADRNPNTQGCLDQGLGRTGMKEILAACTAGKVGALVLQGPELLRSPEALDALGRVPFVAVMATHEEPLLDRAHLVLPAAMWAEVDGTFTNYRRRVQRIRRAFAAPGSATPRWQMAAGLSTRLGAPFPAATVRDVFALLVKAVPDYAGLDFRSVGGGGRALPDRPDQVATQEARA